MEFGGGCYQQEQHVHTRSMNAIILYLEERLATKSNKEASKFIEIWGIAVHS